MAGSDFTPEELAAEEWRPIVGAEDFYAVSNLGRVKRTARGKSTFPGKILAAKRDSSGYRQVRLCLGALRSYRIVLVHHAVYGAFAGARPSDTEINHIDGDKLNNRVGNLEIVTHARNMGHASEAGLLRRGSDSPAAKMTEEGVRASKRLLMGGLSPTAIAESYGVNVACIWAIATGRTWRHVDVEGFSPVRSVRATVRGRKGAHARWCAANPEKVLRGESSPAAKLTEEKVREIRRLREAGVTQQSIADLFGVTQPLVGAIVRRKIWRHVQ